jgi:hypothetical protein
MQKKMGKKYLFFSARQLTYTSVISDQNVPCQAQCDGLEHPPYLTDLLPLDFFFLPLRESVLKGRFAGAKEVSLQKRATRALKRGIAKWFPVLLKALLKNHFRHCFLSWHNKSALEELVGAELVK